MQASKALKILWGLKITPSVAVCSWRLMVDRLPTRSNLSLRGLQLTSLFCPLCLESVESDQHLFVMCKVAQNVWDQCERWVGIASVRHETIEAHFLSFCLLFRRHSINVAWKGMWMAIVTEIWNQRNKVVFNRGIVDAMGIFTLAQLRSWFWFKHKFKGCTSSYLDWYFSPTKCLKSLG